MNWIKNENESSNKDEDSQVSCESKRNRNTGGIKEWWRINPRIYKLQNIIYKEHTAIRFNIRINDTISKIIKMGYYWEYIKSRARIIYSNEGCAFKEILNK